ncbi:multidrug ABC transporter permease [Bifidobacterium animalis subsp. animalis MCC 1489]|uniref:ABC-type multidrug transport system permease comp onent n=1 Tax=Bifidobacterium animalis subsp. animalis IM386 TaxID=1402194 RepID=A0AAV2W1R8_9BIFI|nr:ABC transporter permease [Bifidobacterium animalis]AFI63317.1 ABC-type multidrug transport system permease component [Bifidobacterium animalis subsp. animalis ATCC 25527]AYN23947.1 multidrug ABC transporter permease [Bifidobacterium animalis subsp. animalis]KFI44652.1 ABC-2 family transporter protein [Bifidobacterium animalis subsp. animalis]KOA62944.1 multidrug ABC transporter permease [Bifidobacterium animalis subsp. animalis MCC 1489]CDI66844.1 ABC-type multidrug transport system permeas
MWSTFLNTMRVNLREKSSLFWLFCFPIILSTMFMGMFGNIGEVYEIHTMRFAVVADANFCKATNARQMLHAMQRDPLRNEGCGNAMEGTAPDTASGQVGSELGNLLELQAVPNVKEAKGLINADHGVRGYINATEDGLLNLTISRASVAAVNDDTGNSGFSASLNILHGAVGMFNRRTITVTELLNTDPGVFREATFTKEMGDTPTFTKDVSLTHFKPTESVRFYYALLAMTALMSMTFATTTVCATQANLSTLGMRRSLAPLSRFNQLMGGFLASWLCASVSMVVATLYIHFVCKVDFGGRWPVLVLALLLASLTANALGTLIGSLPKLTSGVKIGITTALSCVLSIFSGLYGTGAMNLSDWIQRNAPGFAIVNPTQQITNLFYDLLYYDSYAPFLRTSGILLAMTVLVLALSTIFLRRQRYEHL